MKIEDAEELADLLIRIRVIEEAMNNTNQTSLLRMAASDANKAFHKKLSDCGKKYYESK